jgi:hypothetical protein
VADLDGDGDLEIAAVGDEGELKVVRDRSSVRSDDGTLLLPDSRLTASDLNGDGSLEIVALTRPVEESGFRQLGDDLAPAAFAVFTWDGTKVSFEEEFTLDNGETFMGLKAVIGEGIDGDRNLVILPVRDEEKGVSLRSYSYRASRIREVRTGPWLEDSEFIHVLGHSNMGDRSRNFILAVSFSEEEGSLVLFRDDLADSRISRDGDILTVVPGTRVIDTAAIADLDNDGIDELLAPGEDRDSLNYFSLKGNRLGEKEIYSGNDTVTSSICPGDYNGDGWPDLAVGMEGGKVLFLMGR